MTTPPRVLGIDPASRSVAYAVLEGPDSLFDWGTKFTSKADSAKALSAIRSLIEIIRPDVIAIEDCEARESRRRARIRNLLDEVVSMAPSTVKIRRIRIHSLASYGKTKDQRALVLAARFPELHPELPKLR